MSSTPRNLEHAADPTRPRCAAVSKTTGKPCGSWPVHGATVCRMHGAGSGKVKAAARRRVARDAALAEGRKVIERLGGSIDIDPGEALVGQVREAAANVEVLRAAVAALDPGRGLVSAAPTAILAADGDLTEGIYGPDHQGDGKPHVLVTMYSDERDRLVKYAKLALDSGIAERVVRMAEQQAQVMARAFAETFDVLAAEMSPELVRKAQKVLAERLRASVGASA